MNETTLLKNSIDVISRVMVLAFAVVILSNCGRKTPSFKSAIYSGDVNSVESFIQNGTNVNLPVADMSPLYLATMFAADLADETDPRKKAKEADRLKIIEILLTSGADPDKKDGSGNTALGRAVKHGHKGVTELLLANGADVNVMPGPKSLLGLAQEKGHREIAEILQKHGGKL